MYAGRVQAAHVGHMSAPKVNTLQTSKDLKRESLSNMHICIYTLHMEVFLNFQAFHYHEYLQTCHERTKSPMRLVILLEMLVLIFK